MPEASASGDRGIRTRAPELALGVLAAVMFLGSLGAVDIWGKREQRASAEAIDTLDHHHWLIAEIQSRKRLEKPPLPRWTIASLMALSGRRDEWIVRLPSALSAIGMVGLIYGLGRRIGGRSVGLSSGLALTSLIFFVTESRQAGNDGPLAFFTTLALYCAWRRLHGGPADEPCVLPGDRLGSRGWAIAMFSALGLAFLTKGPVTLILAAVAIVPYLACSRRLKVGLRALCSGWGILAFVLLALSWPVPVLLNDPKALQIWQLEMGQKAGTAGIKHHRERLLALEWPWMTAPWTLLATWAAVMPLMARGRGARPWVWFPWAWSVGNLAMFCLWSVAKPNYFLPCLPGVALLIGMDWVRITRIAREGKDRGAAFRAKAFLQVHWMGLSGLALAGPALIAWKLGPQFLIPGLVASTLLLGGVILSIRSWRRGGDAGTLLPLVAGVTGALVIGYGSIVPSFNVNRSHRELARRLDRVLPADVRTVMFFRELDEGLWFYLKGRTLEPVPGSQPKYSKDVELQDLYKENRLDWDENRRIAKERKVLVDWLKQSDHASPYVLVRAKVYDRFQDKPGLDDLATPVFREEGLDRNELVLLKARESGAVASGNAAKRR